MDRMSRRRAGLVLGAGLIAALAPPGGQAQSAWPSRPIRLVVGYAPGGGPDILARLLAAEMEKTIGATIVENKPGMGGSTGADTVAKAPPDGHTLLVTTTATQSINPALYSNVPYDALRDFTPIARISNTTTMLVVTNDLPVRSLPELIAYAKQNPGKLSYATAGPGTMQHITAELMRGQAGVDILHVPYKGTSQIMPDLIAGRVSMMFNSPAAVAQFVDEGKLRAIAVTSTQRMPQRPQLPTVAEAGLPGFEATAWYALFGPAGMPREVVQRLNAEVRRILGTREAAARLQALGMDAAPSSPEELGALVQQDLRKWSGVIKASHITAQ